MSTYAIIETGGKQYRAEEGIELLVDRLPADEGDKVDLRAVMFSGDGNVVAAGSDLEKVKVEAKVAGHLRGEKLRVFRYKAKKGYRKRRGHRSELTRLEVTDVKLLSRKPAAKKETAKAETASKKPAPKKETAKAEAAGKKPAAKKQTAARKPAAKKQAKEADAPKKEDS